MPTCDRCGTRLALHDETTKLVEYACPTCHATETVWKKAHRNTEKDIVADTPGPASAAD